MSTEGEPTQQATQTDIQEAINALSDLELVKLGKAGDYYCNGTRYTSGSDLLNEVILRTLNAAVGGEGEKRVWKTSVPFFTYLKQTMQGVANDDRTSAHRRDTLLLADVRVDGTNQEPEFEWFGHWSPDDQTSTATAAHHESQLAEVDEKVTEIERHFDKDEDVMRLIESLKEGQSASEIRVFWDWSSTQYETIRRRFRRGLSTLSTKK